MLIGRPKRDSSTIRTIKDWVQKNLRLNDEAVLSIMELECHEPDCPPLETVIVVMEQGKDTRQWKLHKAMPDITVDDIRKTMLSESASGS